MEDSIDKIAMIIYGLVLILPLLFSIVFLIKLIVHRKNHNAKFIVPFSLLSIFVSSFLIFFIAVRFWFPYFEIPDLLSNTGIVLFFLYWCGFFGSLYGLGIISTQSGRSPSNILKDIFRIGPNN